MSGDEGEVVDGVDDPEPASVSAVPGPLPDDAPVVKLGLLQFAARRDARSEKLATYPEGTALVVAALVEQGWTSAPKNADRFGASVRTRFAAWQDRCGVVVLERDAGVPDELSLRRLGAAAGFKVMD